MIDTRDIIVAPATAAGGALSVIRISGEGAIALCDGIFRGRRPLAEAAGHTLHYGVVADGDETVDDVVAALFRAPNSYTGDDSVEFSCHGSRYIQQRILDLCIRRGARMATAGEFTARAFLAGRLDLSQAEAVADVIAAESRAAHTLAASQMRGAYAEKLGELRGGLLKLVSLLELELDFSEEEVEFADRTTLRNQMERILREIDRLNESFTLGNALKEGVAIAIVGRPNVGKSTLLNRLIGDQRAMVSEIAGTTRDTIEERVNIDGVLFRFIDTAGLHDTADRLERMGIERTKAAIERAHVILHVREASDIPEGPDFVLRKDQHLITVVNKIDLPEPDCPSPSENTRTATENDLGIRDDRHLQESGIGRSETNPHIQTAPLRISAKTGTGIDDLHLQTTANKIDGTEPALSATADTVRISAKTGAGIDDLLRRLRHTIDTSGLFGGDAIVSSSRHAEALRLADDALQRALQALDDHLPSDLLCEELRQVLHHLGAITGQITSDEILANIFSKFCIGK